MLSRNQFAKISLLFLSITFIAAKCDYVYFKSITTANLSRFTLSNQYKSENWLAYKHSAISRVKEVTISINDKVQKHTFDRITKPFNGFHYVFEKHQDPKKITIRTAYPDRSKNESELKFYSQMTGSFLRGNFNQLRATGLAVIAFDNVSTARMKKSFISQEERTWGRAIRILNFRNFETHHFAAPVQEEVTRMGEKNPSFVFSNGKTTYLGPRFLGIYSSKISNK